MSLTKICLVSFFLVFGAIFFFSFSSKTFACIATGANGCGWGSSDSSLWCCDDSAICTQPQGARGNYGTCVNSGTTLPPHDGYGRVNGGSCSNTSICYTGDYASPAHPGDQCGTLTGWHFGTAGGKDAGIVTCVGGISALCCDPGAGGPSTTPTPPNPCPSQNGLCTKVDTALGTLDVSGPGAFIKTAFGVLLSLSGGIAIILIIFSGYRIMIAQGDPEKIKEAREMLTSAIIGLLFMIFSVTILQILGVDILRLPGFGR